MKLYELTGELRTTIDRYNQVETDADLTALGETLTALQMSFDEKCVAVAHHVLGVEAEQQAVETEIARLQDRANRLETQGEWFREYLKRNMEATNTPEVKATTVTLKIKKNPPSVIVEDDAAVPENYKRTKTIVELDKKAIKAAWETGIGVTGTRVEQKTRLEIK